MCAVKKFKKIFQGIGCRQCEKIKIITINRIVRTHPVVMLLGHEHVLEHDIVGCYRFI